MIRKLILVMLALTGAMFAASATDNFDRATFGTTAWQQLNYSSATSTQSGFLKIVGNQVAGDSVFYNIAIRTGTWGSDQTSQVRLVTLGAYSGAVVRGSQNGFYVFMTDGTQTGNFMRKVIPGESLITTTDIGANVNVGSAWSPGDLLKLEVIGTTFNVYRNGTFLVTFTDSTLSTGNPGMLTWTTADLLDDWTGTTTGTITAPPTVTFISSTHLETSTPAVSNTTPVFNTTGASSVVVFTQSHPVWVPGTGTVNTTAVVTDNKSNTYTEINGPTDFSGGAFILRGRTYVCVSPCNVGIGHTVTITFNGSFPVVMHAVAVAGADSVNPVAQDTGWIGGLSSPNITSTAVHAPAGALLYGFAKADSGPSSWVATQSGFTQDGSFSSFGIGQYQTVIAEGNFAMHMTASSAITYEANLIVFQPPSPSYIAVTSSPSGCITDGSGVPIASGKLIVNATDSNNNPLPFRINTGDAAATISTISRTITAGSISPNVLRLGNPLFTAPANILYRFVITDDATHKNTIYNKVPLLSNDNGNFNICKFDPSQGNVLGTLASPNVFDHIAIGGDPQETGSPRGIWSAFVPVVRSTTTDISQMVLEHALNVVEIGWSNDGVTSMSACSTVPKIVVHDIFANVDSVSVNIPNGSSALNTFGTPVNFSMTPGNAYSIRVVAGSGCSTFANNVNVHVIFQTK